MNVFVYRGFDRNGARCKGTIEAGDLKDAREKLLRDGIYADEIQAGSQAGSAPGRPGRKSAIGSARFRAGFYRALSSLMRAGLTMSGALEVLMDEPGSDRRNSSVDIMSMRERIREGSSFSASMLMVCPSLGNFEAAVLESGEKSGRLLEVMIDLADYLDDMERTKELLKTASIYPLSVIVIALLVSAGVLGFMVPRFASALAQMGQELPLITRAVMSLGEWFLPLIMPAIAAGSVLVWIAFRRLSSHQAYRIAWEKRLSVLPLISSGFSLLVTVRFARTCHLLLSGGVSMVDAVSLAGRATGSLWIATAAQEQAESIRHGKSLGLAVGGIPMVNRTLGMWIKAGEAAGDLPAMFLHASTRYRQLWAQFVQRATLFIEPALVVLVAVFVLIIALAIVLPALTMNPDLL